MTSPRTPGFGFRIVARDGSARCGVLTTPHGDVDLPTFMPVGTQGSVKTLGPHEVASTGARIVLGNTYHLWMRPGPEIVQALGGLARFTRWPHATLTDSGGFQAFSLAQRRMGARGNPEKQAPATPNVTITEEGVTFRSHLDGSRHFMSPEKAVEVQAQIGADIQMQLDICPHGEANRDVVEAAVARTTRWAKRALATPRAADQALFGIIQGACFNDLRRAHAEELAALEPGFDGLAFGGFSVGEPIERMHETLAEIVRFVDPERPRYLMGVGTPRDLLEGIEHGVDMFDCVLPTRNARNGQALTRFGKVIVKQARYKEDSSPIDPGCTCACCHEGFSRAYLRHLYMAGEILALKLISLHNLHFYGELMAGARRAITAGAYRSYKEKCLFEMGSIDRSDGAVSRVGENVLHA